MAPLLLDKYALWKAGAVLLLTWLGTFAAGYWAGYQQLSISTDKPLVMSALALHDSASFSIKSPDCVMQDKDVSSQDYVSAENQATIEAPIADKPTEIVADTSLPETKITPVVANPVVVNPVITGSSADEPAVGQDAQPHTSEMAQLSSQKTAKSSLTAPIADQKQPQLAVLQGDVEQQQARYSIQVGMYGNRVNAENLMKMLGAEGFRSYISSYTNKKQQQRFNVRFGFYKDKQLALTALRHYASTHDGNGYLVRVKQPLQSLEVSSTN